MLTIKTNSWLYRFFKFNNAEATLKYNNPTLCKVFWATVYYGIKDIGIALFLAVLATFPSVFLADSMHWIAQGFLLTQAAFWQVPLLIISGAAMWAVFFGLVYLIIKYGCKLFEYLKGKTEDWRNDRKFKNALKEEMARDEELTWTNIWQKAKIAKKDKLCPLIRVEYVE